MTSNEAPAPTRGAGLFVMGHSRGCELAMRMATEERGAEPLGIELAGTGWHYQPEAREILTTATRERQRVGLPRPGARPKLRCLQLDRGRPGSL